MDRTTSGDWIGKYGTDGYVLFAINNTNASAPVDAVSLPPYVHSVLPFKGPPKATFYGADSSNATYLQVPASLNSSASRALGSYGEGCADGCQGTTLDVNISAARAMQPTYLTLYMVDMQTRWGGDDSPIAHAGEQVIRTLDLETKSPIAAEARSHVRDFRGGVYWTLRYDRGVRLRIMPLYGNARLSAIFFDSDDPAAGRW